MLESTIKRLIYNHHDDVDGWQLQDGTLVHFPPHIGAQLCEWIGEGDEVSIDGNHRTNRNGDKILFPTYIESQGWSLTIDHKKPHHQKGDEDRDPPEHERPQVSNQEIMQELRKIRQLIETWT